MLSPVLREDARQRLRAAEQDFPIRLASENLVANVEQDAVGLRLATRQQAYNLRTQTDTSLRRSHAHGLPSWARLHTLLNGSSWMPMPVGPERTVSLTGGGGFSRGASSSSLAPIRRARDPAEPRDESEGTGDGFMEPDIPKFERPFPL